MDAMSALLAMVFEFSEKVLEDSFKDLLRPV